MNEQNEQSEQNLGAEQQQPQYQPQPQYQQPQYQPQPQYRPQPQPQPPYQPQYQPQPQLQRGQGGGWIALLRVFLWIEFICVIIAGVVIFALFIQTRRPLEGIAILIASVLIAFLSVALGMVALDAAKNIKSLTDNSAVIGASILRQERQEK